MKKNVFFTIRETVSAFLVVVLLLALCPVNAHADSFGSISVQTKDNTYSLQVMYSSKGWYVNSEDIARIGNLRVSYNADQKLLFIVRQDPVVILYQADSTEYVQVDDIYYVPLQEASVACGIRFYEVNNKLCFEALRTPKDLIAELGRNVFADKRFRLTEFYLDLGLLGTAAEVTARSYAMVSPFSISAYGKALSGEADQERYNQAMATIIAYDSDDVSSFAALADIDKSFTKTDKMLDAFDWVFEKSSKFSYWLSGSDWTEAELKTLTDQMEFYGELGGVREFLNAYSDVSKIMDLKYILNVILYIETVTEAESNIANAMQKVFSKSDNTHSCVAASKILAYRYGPGTAAVDIMGSAAVEVASNQIDSLFSDLAYGDLDWKTKVAKFIVTKVLDYGFQLSDKSSAIIYLPIYGDIQNDLALYYYNNKYTDSNENYTDLRSVGIMYLKAAIAAYKNFDFDSSLADTISYAKETLKNELNVLLGYAECEYAPDYTNQVILDRLNSQSSVSLPADYHVEVRSCTSDPTAPARSLVSVGNWDGPCYYACRVLDASGNCIRESVFQANCISYYDDPPYELTNITRHGDLWLIQNLGYVNGIAVIFDAVTGSILPLADDRSYITLGDSYLLGVGLTGNPGVTVTDHIYTWSGNYVRSFEEVAWAPWGYNGDAEYYYYTWEGSVFRVWKLNNATAESIVVRDFYGLDSDPFAYHDVTLYDDSMYVDGVYYSY